jgi:hypothetical protein
MVMLSPAVHPKTINIFLAKSLRLVFCHGDRPCLAG